jgi:2-C-methyl-D-erythritol 2,4-cyclodiphosphate synthase
MHVPEFRVGFGYDLHPLVEGRRLVLGGVEIDYPYGLDGHSDADVLSHAIIDAILGAADLGDLGDNFPPLDDKYKDISSLSLLEIVRIKLDKVGHQIGNIDATVVCDKPILGDMKQRMARAIAAELDMDENDVSVKATTTEGLGVTGEGKAIAAYAVVLISEILGEEEETEYEDDYDDE